MKFKRLPKPGGDPNTVQQQLPASAKPTLKTIEKKPKKKSSSSVRRVVSFRGLFDLDGKENRGLLKRNRPGGPTPADGTSTASTAAVTAASPSKDLKRRPEDVLVERMAQGLSLWSSNGTATTSTEAKPIAKPVMSFAGPQNYFKRSFSMRARATQPPIQIASGSYEEPSPALPAAAGAAAVAEIKTATIRRAFGKSLTSKDRIRRIGAATFN